jgi:hypothetical protein
MKLRFVVQRVQIPPALGALGFLERRAESVCSALEAHAKALGVFEANSAHYAAIARDQILKDVELLASLRGLPCRDASAAARAAVASITNVGDG